MIKWKKCNINTARKNFESGLDVAVKPCKMRFETAAVVNINDKNFEFKDFNSFKNAFIYYNCSNETGKTLQYYIKEE